MSELRASWRLESRPVRPAWIRLVSHVLDEGVEDLLTLFGWDLEKAGGRVV